MWWNEFSHWSRVGTEHPKTKFNLQNKFKVQWKAQIVISFLASSNMVWQHDDISLRQKVTISDQRETEINWQQRGVQNTEVWKIQIVQFMVNDWRICWPLYPREEFKIAGNAK